MTHVNTNNLMVTIMFILWILCDDAESSDFTHDLIPADQIHCLALNVYHEARDQNHAGQVAAAFVPLNRVKSKRFPDTICGVIQKGYKPGRRDCHFSWYCDGLSDTPYEEKAWETSQAIANWVAYEADYITDPTNGATHYHARSVSPWWASKLSYLTDIGDHAFYVEGELK